MNTESKLGCSLQLQCRVSLKCTQTTAWVVPLLPLEDSSSLQIYNVSAVPWTQGAKSSQLSSRSNVAKSSSTPIVEQRHLTMIWTEAWFEFWTWFWTDTLSPLCSVSSAAPAWSGPASVLVPGPPAVSPHQRSTTSWKSWTQ